MSPVKRIEEGMDRTQVDYTTYQMRNPFRQLYDAVATELDIHCYLQHAQAADLAAPGARVLDVCCGRGLLIPFLRYRGSPPALYVGVDAAPENARWKDGADPRREAEQKKDGWGFPVRFVQATANSMAGTVGAVLAGTGDPCSLFDLIVYTSAIEHMQPAWQAASLLECAKMTHAGTVLYLTCPVTAPGRSGYEAQYAAHVYEPSEAELLQWLDAAGWVVRRRQGLCTGAKAFRARLPKAELQQAEDLYDRLPREFALVLIATLFPACAQEMAYTCTRQAPQGVLFDGEGRR